MQSEIKKGGKNKIYQELARNGEEHGKNSRSLTKIYPTKRKELTDVGFTAVLWTVQGDAAAKDDEDAELCCGGGARAAREQ